MSLNEAVDRMLRDAVAGKTRFDERDLDQLLRLLAKWRHALISNTLVARNGHQVLAGPFAGLKFVANPSEGCHAPRILGCYEHELHPSIETLTAQPFESLLNIGCADGYYAVGLAMRMPAVRVFAHDIKPAAREGCAALAKANDVTDRIEIGGEFRGEDFARFAGCRTWLFMDIEGGERELLDPVAYPALREMTIVVECHDCFIPGLSDEIDRRFAPTHVIEKIEHGFATPQLPDWLKNLGHLDNLLATWEWRMGPTPWRVMVPRP